jgi:hypothetical protein
MGRRVKCDDNAEETVITTEPAVLAAAVAAAVVAAVGAWASEVTADARQRRRHESIRAA